MDTCVFCRIVRGELPASVIHEDEHTLAFMNIMAGNPGHALVIVKPHVENIYTLDDALAAAVFRTTTRAVQVGGHDLPEGAKVLLFYAAANRDPRHWDRGDAFDITRSASGHFGFGYGIHQCLGQMVARFEAEAVLDALIALAGALRLAGPVERPLNNTLHPIGRLPIELEAG